MNITNEVREAAKAEALRLVNEKLALKGIQPQHQKSQCINTDSTSDEVVDNIE